MKSFKILIFLIYCIGGQAQSTIVRYQNYKKVDDQKYVSFLVFNSSKSICIDSYITLYNNFQELLSDQDFVESKKFIRNIKKDSIYSNTYYGITSISGIGYVIYKDEVEKTNWNLSAEKDEILGYQCSIASAEFRGRKYKVWYSSSIPVPLGPWKLGGLPGLILKVDVDNGEYTFEATRIDLNSKLAVPDKYEEYYENNLTNIIPYEKYIPYENKYLEQVRKKGIANLPEGVILTEFPPIRNTFIEKSFPWSNKKINK